MTWQHNAAVYQWELTRPSQAHVSYAVSDEAIERNDWGPLVRTVLGRVGSVPPPLEATARAMGYAVPVPEPTSPGPQPTPDPGWGPGGWPLTHPDIVSQYPASNERTGVLRDRVRYRFGYDRGYAQLKLGYQGSGSWDDGHALAEWAIGAPTETWFVSEQEQNRVFAGMLAARRRNGTYPTIPSGDTLIRDGGWHHGLDPQQQPRITARQDVWPAGWQRIGTTDDAGALWSANPGAPGADPIADMRRMVERLRERRPYAPPPGPPRPPSHTPGVTTCRCLRCVARRASQAGLPTRYSAAPPPRSTR